MSQDTIEVPSVVAEEETPKDNASEDLPPPPPDNTEGEMSSANTETIGDSVQTEETVAGSASAAVGGGGGEAEQKAGNEDENASTTESQKPSGVKPVETRKKSSQKEDSRKASMFQDPGAKANVHGTGEELKNQLNELFAYNSKEQAETSSAIKPLRRPKLIYENTYRLTSSKPFSPSRVQASIQEILDDMLMDFRYSSKTSANKAVEVAEALRKKVLAFRFERYKICVLVTISPLNRQGFFNGFRCLWDANRDSYAVATVRNPSLFAIAVCYGIYFE